MGFKVVDSKVYACWVNGGSEYTEELDDIDPEDIHHYTAKMTSFTKIDFYVDYSLLYTATTNLPNSTSDYNLVNIQIYNANSADIVLLVRELRFFQDI
jgi:hypothetical protein